MASHFKFVVLTALSAFLCRPAQADPAPDFIRKNAFPIGSALDLPDEVYAQIEGHKAILVGEMHGTNETPAFVEGLLKLLVKNNRSVLLALEIPATEQARIDFFLKTGDVEIIRKSKFFTRDFQDGRASGAVLRLLSAARALRGLSVVCYDAASAMDAQDRDLQMAQRLATAFSEQGKDVMVVLAGNVHASTGQGVPWNEDYRPMGYELLNGAKPIFTSKDVLAIKVRSESGNAWVCSGQKSSDCKSADLGRGNSNYARSAAWSNYFLLEPTPFEGYNATFFSRTTTASPPFVQKSTGGSPASDGDKQLLR